MSAACGACRPLSVSRRPPNYCSRAIRSTRTKRCESGLVSEVVPHEALVPRAMALAARIAANPPLALRAMKEGLRRATFGDPREIGSWAIETIYRLFQTEDHREGVRSSLERRPPLVVQAERQ